MCGISGIYRFDGCPIDSELLERMTSIIRHRGPDGSGSYRDAGIGLGHRRLSIIDLEGGAQPICNEDATLQVVFNGEIYNFIELRQELETRGHLFKTKTDTEVIVHGYEEWGKDCVSRFNGIFAFALWDATTRRLFLARDHLGVKPLYYVCLNNQLLFASEIKSLLQSRCPREVDLNALEQLFTFRYVPSPNTLFKGIKKLPPAHWMLCDANGIHIERYWKWISSPVNGATEEDLTEQYRTLLEDAIRMQLRSDVPVGLFLSSGIDSATILAIMSSHVTKPVHTFTIGFEEGEKTNETTDARKIAALFGADHTELVISPNDYEKYYDRYLWDLEEPLGNETAAAFYFVSWLASQKVKVALTGQGADEPWGGYHRYLGVKLSETYSKLPHSLTVLLRKAAGTFTRNERIKRGVASLDEADILTRFAKIYSFYSAQMKEDLFQPWVKEAACYAPYGAKDALARLHMDVKHLDPLTQMLYIDTRASLPDDLLMVSDKTSMANSIEARVPYLDYRLIEFIESLPPPLKLNGFRGKYLHKKAVAKWLPKEMVHKRKKGFANPIEHWLRNRLRTYTNDLLLNKDSAVSEYFNQAYIRNMIDLHNSEKEHFLRHLYLLISFELWHRQFISQKEKPGLLESPVRGAARYQFGL
jgi:asparagine synthase (glutamine-hydrolysing)